LRTERKLRVRSAARLLRPRSSAIPVDSSDLRFPSCYAFLWSLLDVYSHQSKMNRFSRIIFAIVALAGLMFGQNRGQRAPARPAPRWPDGRVNLGTSPGEKGHWIRQGRAQLANNPGSVIAAGPGGLSTNLTLPDVPFQPWARALYEYRQAN